MANTLITFLGRPAKKEGAYQKTRYAFADGTQTEPMAFVGWSLQERIAPDRMIILGTAGSMWDHLFEGDLDFGSHSDTERMALMEAVETQNVSQSQLDALAPALAQKLGCAVRLLLIPYARTEPEQVEILRIIAEQVAPQDQVHLDVTHGFRHLPMLALLAAFFLRIVRHATIEGIWYGSYDPDTKQSAVLDLSGLLQIGDGIQALASFDKDGDYRVFVPVLQSAGVGEDVCQLLAEAAYYENILNVGEATGKLRKALPLLDQQKDLRSDASLFLPDIKNRLGWIQKEKQFDKQIALSKQSLERHDYLRSVLYAFEALITRLCQMANVPVQDFESREAVRKSYELLNKKWPPEREQYQLLKNLRNQIAHGTRGSRRDVQRALLQEQEMERTIQTLLQKIEAYRLPGDGFREELSRSKQRPTVSPKDQEDGMSSESDDEDSMDTLET